ncbi:glycosyltransferase [Pediococcus pentosaceus]|uniref:glycosyltransferase n=1 Tax=Pediococcus pentosaceus TaxID=1255 RepID=UPI002B4BD7AB|nr:glycosyltransferase [Pediococcus pentosaceus]MEB3376384.1 glycosyltransferase [Pediococcus pentosaceus]
MKNIIIVAPILSGQGGTETVIKKVLKRFDKKSQFNVKLLLLGEPPKKDWLKDIDEKQLIICESHNKILRIFWFVRFLLTEHINDLIIINTQLIHIAHLVKGIFKRDFLIYSWIHFSLDNSNTVNLTYLKEADKHLAISSGIKKQLINLEISPRNIELIYNPISTNLKKIKRSQDGVFRFLYMGRVEYNHQKNVELLLRSLTTLEGNWLLVIIGDGDDVKKCKKLADELGIKDRIVWKGWKSFPWSTLDEIDALVLPSNYEGLPMVLLEALSYGIPCVSTDCPTGPEDIIEDKYNGRLVKMNEPVDLSDKMRWIMKNLNELKEETLKSSINKFYDDNYFERLENIFSEMND